MNIEKLSIFDLPQIYDYNGRLEGGRIYCKIDTLTFMFKNVTINSVLRWLHLSESLGEFVDSMQRYSGGMSPKFVFTCYNIRIEVPQMWFYSSFEPIAMFDVVCPEIRLYLGGEALDYLRSIGVDFYDHRFVVPDLGEGGTYHCTRVDWAFDFVDYKPTFLDDLIDYVSNNSLPSGRVPVANTAFKYTLRLGGEKTLYIGSPTSDKLLRCYDKRMQLRNPDTGLWLQDPYGNPESWYRIELQLRNQTAHSSLFSKDPDTGEVNSFISILKRIFDTYSFADPEHDIHHYGSRPVVDFWQKFLPWDEIKSVIVQNAKYVEPKNIVDRSTYFVERVAMRNLITYIQVYGFEGLMKSIHDYIRSTDYERDLYDDSAPRRRDALFSRIENTCDITGTPLPTSKVSGLWNNCGRLEVTL